MHILATQGIGELADFFVQFAVGNVPAFAGIVAFPDDRHLVAALFEVAVKAVLRDVEGAVGEPLDVDVVVVEGGLLDRSERLDPIETLGLLAPETIGVDHRLLVHRLVGRFIRQGGSRYFGTNRVKGSRTHH